MQTKNTTTLVRIPRDTLPLLRRLAASMRLSMSQTLDKLVRLASRK